MAVKRKDCILRWPHTPDAAGTSLVHEQKGPLSTEVVRLVFCSDTDSSRNVKL